MHAKIGKQAEGRQAGRQHAPSKRRWRPGWWPLPEQPRQQHHPLSPPGRRAWRPCLHCPLLLLCMSHIEMRVDTIVESTSLPHHHHHIFTAILTFDHERRLSIDGVVPSPERCEIPRSRGCGTAVQFESSRERRASGRGGDREGGQKPAWHRSGPHQPNARSARGARAVAGAGFHQTTTP